MNCTVITESGSNYHFYEGEDGAQKCRRSGKSPCTYALVLDRVDVKVGEPLLFMGVMETEGLVLRLTHTTPVKSLRMH